jgi:hypothetical protein
VHFNASPCREAGEPGILLDGIEGANLMRQRGRWSQWVNHEPESISLRKVNGKWVVNEDTFLLRGKMPTAADWANAGVK